MSDENETSGATPGDDTSGLLQTHLTNRRARDVAELEAIDLAYEKYIFKARRKTLQGGWFCDEFIRKVHFDMFGTIWDWAGKYRTQTLNLGIEPHLIAQQIQILCGDFNYWNSSECSMAPIEVAARVQNRLTRIHPFKNGNGRHARFIIDIFFNSRGHRLPRWPQVQLISHGEKIRERYITAMKAADQEDYSELMVFIKECLGS